MASLLAKLYQSDVIGEEVKKLVQDAPEETEAKRFNQAAIGLEELLAQYGKVKGILVWVMRVLNVAKEPLMGFMPWGPLAVYATYLGILGYAVYSDGDYLDWYRLGEAAWLDRVEGLRTTVRTALAPGD